MKSTDQEWHCQHSLPRKRCCTVLLLADARSSIYYLILFVIFCSEKFHDCTRQLYKYTRKSRKKDPPNIHKSSWVTQELFLLLRANLEKVKEWKRVRGPDCCSEGLGDSAVPDPETQMLEVYAQGFSESWSVTFGCWAVRDGYFYFRALNVGNVRVQFWHPDQLDPVFALAFGCVLSSLQGVC